MKIEYTGRPGAVPDRLRTLAERKLARLEKVLHGITHVHVVLESEGRRRRAEVTVQSRQLSLAASQEGRGFSEALAAVLDKLTRQAQKRSGRRLGKVRRGTKETALWSGVLTPQLGDEGGVNIVRSQRFVPEPMTIDEAAVAVEGRDEGFVVYRDARTEQVSMLYRRKDGNLGLIEPEA